MKKTQIQKNYDDYLNEGDRIGFTQTFPVGRIIETIRIPKTCRGFDVIVEVNIAKADLGKINGKTLECDIIVTNNVSISKRLFLNGFGSHCHIEEGEAMQEAVIEVCKQKDLMICDKICTWPFTKAVVQPNIYDLKPETHNSEQKVLICNSCKEFYIAPKERCDNCDSTTLTETHKSNADRVINDEKLNDKKINNINKI